MSARSSRTPSKSKKPPACDACKFKRVLCHPQPGGSPCPRCSEKGIVCKTTPIPRGRPRKHTSDAIPSEDPQPSSESSIFTLQPQIELSACPELSSDLVKHLVDSHFPLARFPILRGGDGLRKALASAAWQVDLLPPQLRVLVCCVCALSSSISFHESIIGPGLRPDSFQDRCFFPGSDLREYGARRAPVFHALHKRAYTLACEARITLEPSEPNAASCFILDVLERYRIHDMTSRPWAVAYVSHIRTLAASWEQGDLDRAVWGGFLMAEALMATSRRMPVLVTHNDQLLMTGVEPPSLEQLFKKLQAIHQVARKPGSVAFTAIRPFLFHVVRLARELYESITGVYARRQPLAEVAVVNFLASLSILQSIVALTFDSIPALDRDGEPAFPSFAVLPLALAGAEANMRASAFAMAFGFTSLVLALHQEMEYRATVGTGAVEDRWAQERVGVLRRQTHELASAAVGDVKRALQLLTSLPHLVQVPASIIEGWAQFLLAEADACGTVPSEHVDVFEMLQSALKLFGYSGDTTHSSGLIDRMEVYLAKHRNPANSSLAHLFPLDNSWTGMFPLDIGLGDPSLTYYDNFGTSLT
ncbi:hypothetical protein DFH07DRAFT_949826 [Mycena maculata]|uniref:Zn(2)-C6 fungal-type domain-containing protein n=1 Tax=Mycena maculata TaxID=230809 RepID=A0AAD7K8F8_9AGAR|nr:hypothetical protein DFH07DRAFT_949826 [Mycena maculata]